VEALNKVGFGVTEVGRQLLIVFVRFSMSIVLLGIVLSAYGWAFYWIQEWFNVIYLRSLGLLFLQLNEKIITVAIAAYQGSYTFPAGLKVPLAPIVVAVGLVGVVGPFKQPHRLFLQLYAVNLGGAAFLTIAAVVIRLFQPTDLPQAWVSYAYLALVVVVLMGCLVILPVDLFRKTYDWWGAGNGSLWNSLVPWFYSANAKTKVADTRLEQRVGSPEPYDTAIGKLLRNQLQVEGILLTGVSVRPIQV
jgi:hypothetical protein